ncbi:MAG: hypothetical protein ABIC91_07375 [Nanoarchaeota archaeon]|nr:hypothetical protein [Nanoarchaeota archaeon]MBU1031224.1 hypothetical protein [Nanoarchaeota archaeon]MBU1849220.1 hypothetical protein [Nanoarchaeota archaeon]
MVTIAHIVEKLVEQKPFLQEALNRGVINHAALAEDLKPLIEKELNKKVKFSAVNMAIRRLSEKLKTSFIETTRFDSESDLTIKSNLIEIVLYKEKNVQEQIKKIYDLIDISKGDILTVTQGFYEVMIITNSKHKENILKQITSPIKKIITDLSSITINLSETAIETVGLFYITTRALNWDNINIVDIVSTFTEMTFIIKENDTPRAFQALQSILKHDKNCSST